MATPTDIHAHKFIFIGGLHRSGTSLLFRILRSHPEISGFHNTSVPEDEGSHLQTVYTQPKYLGKAGFFALHPDAHQDNQSPLITEQNRKKLWNEWRPYWDRDCSYLLEKSPSNILLTRFLQEMFPNTYFLIIVRHPVAVSLATRRWFWFFQLKRYRLDRLFENWVVAHELFEQDQPFLKRVHIIRFEQLIKHPEETLESVYQFLQIRRHKHDIDIMSDANIKYFQEWRSLEHRFVTRPFIKYLKHRYAERVKNFGYEFDKLGK